MEKLASLFFILLDWTILFDKFLTVLLYCSEELSLCHGCFLRITSVFSCLLCLVLFVVSHTKSIPKASFLYVSEAGQGVKTAISDGKSWATAEVIKTVGPLSVSDCGQSQFNFGIKVTDCFTHLTHNCIWTAM